MMYAKKTMTAKKAPMKDKMPKDKMPKDKMGKMMMPPKKAKK